MQKSVSICLDVALGCARQPILVSQGGCRQENLCNAIGFRLQLLAHLFGPSLTLGPRPKEGFSELLDIEAGVGMLIKVCLVGAAAKKVEHHCNEIEIQTLWIMEFTYSRVSKKSSGVFPSAKKSKKRCHGSLHH